MAPSVETGEFVSELNSVTRYVIVLSVALTKPRVMFPLCEVLCLSLLPGSIIPTLWSKLGLVCFISLGLVASSRHLNHTCQSHTNLLLKKCDLEGRVIRYGTVQ